MSEFCLSACNVPHNKKNNTDTNSSIDFQEKFLNPPFNHQCALKQKDQKEKRQRERERDQSYYNGFSLSRTRTQVLAFTGT